MPSPLFAAGVSTKAPRAGRLVSRPRNGLRRTARAIPPFVCSPATLPSSYSRTTTHIDPQRTVLATDADALPDGAVGDASTDRLWHLSAEHYPVGQARRLCAILNFKRLSNNPTGRRPSLCVARLLFDP